MSDDQKDAAIWEYGISDSPKTQKARSNLSNYLSGFDFESYKGFKQLLKNTGSIIAGGSILSAIHNEKINDIDIYAHKEGARQIIEFLNKHYYHNNFKQTFYEHNISPAYDESFLRANNIKIRFNLNYKGRLNSFSRELETSIDIMIVDDSLKLENVVSNFDLTFCQVYFDGEKFVTSHPDHVIAKSGFLEDSYIKSLLKFNKFTINRIQKYKEKNYTIKYTLNKIHCETLLEMKQKKTVVSLEEWIVKKIYDHLIRITRQEAIPKNEFIISHFLLLDFTYEGLFKFITKNIKDRCFIPGWMICHYKTDSSILKHYLLYSLTSKLSNPFENIKLDEYRDCVVDFIQKKIGFPEITDTDKLDSYKRKMMNRKDHFFGKPFLVQYYNLLSKICILKKIQDRNKTEIMKLKGKTRSIEKLNIFVNPSSLSRKIYPEKNLIEDKITGRCKDLLTTGLNNINAYLKGEKVEAYTIDGERPPDDDLEDYDYDQVTPEEARKRLVFFVETRDGYIPVCYNLDMIENIDIKSAVYSTTCEGESLRNINAGFDDPIFKLNMGDFQVFVYLKSLLWALYKTKKQVFILTKPDLPIYFSNTASLQAVIGTDWTSLDHCQNGSDKYVYNIEICEEKDGNLCYPIIEANEIDLIDITDPEKVSEMKRIKIKASFESELYIEKLESEANSILQNKLEGNDNCSDYVDYVDDSDDSDDSDNSDHSDNEGSDDEDSDERHLVPDQSYPLSSQLPPVPLSWLRGQSVEDEDSDVPDVSRRLWPDQSDEDEDQSYED
jgi:hypothetical protein